MLDLKCRVLETVQCRCGPVLWRAPTTSPKLVLRVMLVLAVLFIFLLPSLTVL